MENVAIAIREQRFVTMSAESAQLEAAQASASKARERHSRVEYELRGRIQYLEATVAGIREQSSSAMLAERAHAQGQLDAAQASATKASERHSRMERELRGGILDLEATVAGIREQSSSATLAERAHAQGKLDAAQASATEASEGHARVERELRGKILDLEATVAGIREQSSSAMLVERAHAQGQLDAAQASATEASEGHSRVERELRGEILDLEAAPPLVGRVVVQRRRAEEARAEAAAAGFQSAVLAAATEAVEEERSRTRKTQARAEAAAAAAAAATTALTEARRRATVDSERAIWESNTRLSSQMHRASWGESNLLPASQPTAVK